MYPYLVWLAAASIITFILYGLDKARSKRKGARRMPEIVLHVLALAGGFIGGWVGRSLFHHKTKKGFFVFILVMSMVIHAGLVWLVFLGMSS